MHEAVQTEIDRYTLTFVYRWFPLYLAYAYMYWYIAIYHTYWYRTSLPITKAATPKRIFQGTLDFTYSNSVYCKAIITGHSVRRFPSPYGKKRHVIAISIIAILEKWGWFESTVNYQWKIKMNCYNNNNNLMIIDIK